MTKAPASAAHKLSDTHANDSTFLKADEILGIPFTLTRANIQYGQFKNPDGTQKEQAICTIVFHASTDDTLYQFSNGGGRFLNQVQNLVEHDQFPVIACVERNEAGRAGPNGIHPLMLMDPRSERGGVDKEWTGAPQRQ